MKDISGRAARLAGIANAFLRDPFAPFRNERLASVVNSLHFSVGHAAKTLEAPERGLHFLTIGICTRLLGRGGVAVDCAEIEFQRANIGPFRQTDLAIVDNQSLELDKRQKIPRLVQRILQFLGKGMQVECGLFVQQVLQRPEPNNCSENGGFGSSRYRQALHDLQFDILALVERRFTNLTYQEESCDCPTEGCCPSTERTKPNQKTRLAWRIETEHEGACREGGRDHHDDGESEERPSVSNPKFVHPLTPFILNIDLGRDAEPRQEGMSW